MSAERREAKKYRTASGVSWIAQDDGILIVDEVARRSETLDYPEAAVWDMACRGHDLASIETALRWIMGDAGEDSGASMSGDNIAREILERWVREGLLYPRTENVSVRGYRTRQEIV